MSLTDALIQMSPILVAFVVLYFVLLRPQKKQEKKLQQMRNDLQIADEIVTAGGIVGRVVGLKDDTVLIETGTDRNKIRIKKWAIQGVTKLETAE